MLVHFIRLFLLPLYEGGQGPTSDYIEAFAHLVMDHHWKSSLNKDRRLEDTILELLQIVHLVVYQLEIFL